MRNKFGPHGTDVEAFLAEVAATTDPHRWNELLAGRDMDARARAGEAIAKAGLSASVMSAVDRGAGAAYRSLKLTDADLPNAVIGRLDVSNMIKRAASTLSLGDRLAPQHRRAMLHRFAETGFASVLSSHAWTTAEPSPTGPHPPDTERA